MRTSKADGGVQLKIEEDDNYILFFQDRRVVFLALDLSLLTPFRIKVEQDYISGLKRLYSRSKAIDTLHDEYAFSNRKGLIRR